MRQRKYTKEFLEPFIKKCTCYSQLIKLLGLKNTGGIHRLLTMRVKEYGFDISHFTGPAWNKGKTKCTDLRVLNNSIKTRSSHSEVFCENSGFPTSKLYKRLIELGWKEMCFVCGIKDWLKNPIRFHVDHKNGNHIDNRLENLRFLCPNCHQQTDTWGAKNRLKS